MGNVLNQFNDELGNYKNITHNYDFELIHEKRRDAYVNLHNEVKNKYWKNKRIVRLQRKTNNQVNNVTDNFEEPISSRR